MRKVTTTGVKSGLIKTMRIKTTAAVGMVLKTVTKGLKNALKRSKTPPRTPKAVPTSKDIAREIMSLKSVPPIEAYVSAKVKR